MRWMAVALAASLLVASAPARSADDADRLRIAREVVEAAHAADNLRAIFPAMVNQMRGLLAQQQAADPKAVDLYLQRFQAKFESGIPGFVDLVAEVYAREFTEADLTDLLAFYKTPAGQHLLAKQTEIAKGMMAVGQRWGQGIAEEVLAEIRKEKQGSPPAKL